MGFLVTLVLTVLDPFRIIRNYLIKPVATLGIAAIEEYRERRKQTVESTKSVFLKLIVLVLIGFSIVWSSIFLYVYFYYSYMPTVQHVKDVNLNFRVCKQSVDCQPYPTANVALTNSQRFLMVGQAYRIMLHLEMPESENNGKIGMFTVCAKLKNYAHEDITESCRLAMLHYKSDLLKTILTFVFAPFLVLGYREEKQLVTVELFTDYLDDAAYPTTNVEITIHSKDIQLYSAQLHIVANFTGLRYLMFNWPVLSAIIGITTNLFFILIVCILSWYHWEDTEWLSDIRDRYQQIVQSSIVKEKEVGKLKGQEEPLQSKWIIDEE